MAILPRLCLPGIPQHIIQRGTNMQACFASEDGFAAYAHWLDECAKNYRVAIHAWVLMTNHVHLLVTPETSNGISVMMQTLCRYYVRYFNHTYRRPSTLHVVKLSSHRVGEYYQSLGSTPCTSACNLVFQVSDQLFRLLIILLNRAG